MNAGQRGLLAKLTGDVYEELVDRGLYYYRANDMVTWVQVYPKIRITRYPNAVVVGKAHPDRHVTIPALGGRSCWLEIKSWQAKERNTYNLDTDNRRDQYQNLLEEVRIGGALGYYLVCWRWNGQEDWRLYPAESLQLSGGGLRFVRAVGLAVGAEYGWPDWLAVVVEVQSRGTARLFGDNGLIASVQVLG